MPMFRIGRAKFWVGDARAGVIGSAALLAACSDVRLSPPNLALPRAFEATATSSGALSAQRLDSWWRLFDDPQLTGLIDQALVASPDARSALARIAEARATRAQTLAAFYPSGALSGSAQQQHTSASYGGLGIAAGSGASTSGGSTGQPGSGSTGAPTSAFVTPSGDLQTYGAQFEVSYELDIFGRRRAAKRAADADLAAQRFDYEATRSSLATNVATALFQARGYAVQLRDAQETLRIAQDLAHTAELSAARGLTSTSDSARLETDVATAQAEVARLQGVERGARRSLLALIGRGFDRSDTVDIQPTAATPPVAPSTAPGDLLQRRPDVREAEARLRSAVGTLALDRLALFPRFDLAPGLQLAKTTGSYDSLTTVWSIGLNATAPILDRPRLLAVVRAQRARAEEAVAAYERSVQNAYRDAENGLATLAADTERATRLQTAVDRSRFAFDAKRRGYDLGLVDLTTLLDAERSWRQATSALSSARIIALVDCATLFQALGGGWASGVDAAGGSRA